MFVPAGDGRPAAEFTRPSMFVPDCSHPRAAGAGKALSTCVADMMFTLSTVPTCVNGTPVIGVFGGGGFVLPVVMLSGIGSSSLPITQDVGNLEGKELRFGTSAGPLWAVVTTSTSNGSVNAMHDSLNPLAGMMPMIGMWLNEDFGGVGVGMVNMFMYIIVGVFIAGMMIGRTPEYLGWRVEAKEVKFAMMGLLSHGFFILVGTAIFAVTPWGAETLNNIGPHGFSEILYEFSSAAANNGSGFEGLGDNTVAWNIATGTVMLLARFIPIILPLAIVGSLSAKRRATESSGTLSVEDGTFAGMLTATVVIVGALTFFPAATLGPIAEHVMFMK